MSSLFGGTDYKSFSTITPEQQGLLSSMISNYSALGNKADIMKSAYQGAPENYFSNSFVRPMKEQYLNSIADLKHSMGRHSSASSAAVSKARSSYLTGLGQQRSEFLNQERLREIQSLNDLRAAQQGMYGLQNQAGATALGTRAFENVAQQDSGTLGQIMSMINAGGSIGSMFGGFASQGMI